MFAGEFHAHAEAGGLFRLPPIFLAAFPPPQEAVGRQVVVLKSLDRSLWLYQAQGWEVKLDFVDTELHQRVEKAAAAAGVKIAPWLRQMVRQVSEADFPASWQTERSEERSHGSHTYGTRFMLRLDEPSQIKLQRLIKQFGVSKAEIIRQLIAYAKPEDFPKSWQIRIQDPRAPGTAG